MEIYRGLFGGKRENESITAPLDTQAPPEVRQTMMQLQLRRAGIAVRDSIVTTENPDESVDPDGIVRLADSY